LFTSADYKRGKRRTGAKKKTGAAGSPHELNVFGHFPSYWDNRAHAIVGAVKTRNWYPGTAAMKEFAAQGSMKGTETLEVGEIIGLFRQLGEIGRHRPKTISRLNFFAHGADDGTIWVSGEVTEDNVDFKNERFSLSNQNMLDAEQQVFDPLKRSPLTPIEKQKALDENITIDDVRQAFTADATVVIYACHSAVDKAYLGDVGKLFGARIQGFKKMTVWNISYNEKDIITGRRFGLEGSSTLVTDFHQLQPDIDIKPQR